MVYLLDHTDAEGLIQLLYRSPLPNEVLVVDLDGLLIGPDLELEAFWAALVSSPLALLSRHRFMRDTANVHVPSLPYNDEIVACLRRWRSDGGRTILVTALGQALAERIAGHVGVFDGVYGSTGKSSINGAEKAAMLEDRFGDRGFAFMGRAAADLPVWQKCSRAITVDASSAVRSRVDGLGLEARHLETARRPSVYSYLATLRPHQWLKNCLVFVPMLAAHQFTAETFWPSLLAFIAFSLTASSVYVLNDLLDLAVDRAHPRKRNRPLASGSLPIAHGTRLVPLLLLSGLAFALPLGRNFILVLLAYFAGTTIYSLYIKRQIVMDICMLAGLYTLRIVAGGVATEIALSVWLLAFSIFIFFALAAVKRQAELVDSVAADAVQPRGRGYHVSDLPLISSMAIASGYASVLVLALYVNSPDVLPLYNSPAALWGICVVLLYWISRMVIITHRGNMHDDPLIYAVKDPVSQTCLLLVIAFGIGGTIL